MKKMIGVLVVAAVIATQARAAEDLVNCKWANGEPIKPKVCEVMRKHAEKSRAEAEAQRLMFERADAARAEEEKNA